MKIFVQGFFFALLFLSTGVTTSVAQTTPDPGLMGTHAVLKGEYNLGDAAYTPPAAAAFPYNMEVAGSVHYPADLSSGPFPVVVFLHGRHETCYDSLTLATSSVWPCTGTKKSITSYEGYDYVARTLASHGYIVISISANSINAHDASLSDYGMNARGVLTQHHLDLWNTWNTTSGGPFDTTFIGKLNMQNIGTMGHSRGGEGVVFNAEYNRSLGSPYGIRAVLTLAPVDFLRHVLNGIPLLDIAPYCDGDVNDLQGIHFYDDARYNTTTDLAPKHTILFMGANHNFFNTVWTPGSYIAGGGDDWLYTGLSTTSHCGMSAASSKRFDTTKQKAALNAYLPAFFRLYLGNESQFAPIFEVNDIVPPASSMLDSTNVFVSYHAGKTDRLDINRTDSLVRDTTNTLTGAVAQSALTAPAVCGGGFTMAVCDAAPAAAQRPHRGSATRPGLAQMRIKWTDTTGWYENAIPAANQDFTGYQNLMFRAAVNFTESVAGVGQDFTVQLTDSAGNNSNKVVSSITHALFYQPGVYTGDLPKLVLNTIHLPLSGFTGVNLAKIRNVRFMFNKSTAGAVVISDVAVTNPICGNFNAKFGYNIGAGNHVTFTDSSTVTGGDTLSWSWKFGDPTTGVNDSSTLKNPTHNYSHPGTYTACLYITTRRQSGLVCTDTLCRTIATHLGIADNSTDNINIFPNPANDRISVTGTQSTDVLKLVNLYGQVVLTTSLTQQTIMLPAHLANGIYYAVIYTDKGTAYKKLLLSR